MSPERIPECRVSALPPTGIVEISGGDARSFLQGQLTSDIRKLGRQSSQLAAWCNPQGRVIATLRVVDVGHAVWLLLPVDQVRHVAERMPRFVLRADVKIAARDGPAIGFGLQGAGARELLQPAGLEPPGVVDGADVNEDAILVRVAGTPERYEIYAREGRDGLPALPGATIDEDGGEGWRLGNIAAGLPAVHGATRESFLPQMLNLDVLKAVSFTKGCYAGQEIVARTQNLGSVKRRMLRFAARRAPAPGSRVHAGDIEAGTVVEAARANDHAELLAVVRLDCANEPLSGADGALRLEHLAIPYSLP